MLVVPHLQDFKNDKVCVEFHGKRIYVNDGQVSSLLVDGRTHLSKWIE